MTFPIKYGILKVIQPYQERAKLHGKSGRCTRSDSGNFRQSQAEACCRPAPDGEEFFAMALFFAAHRWGNGEGIFNYEAEAKKLLHACVHNGDVPGKGYSMWDAKNHLIKFIPECDYTDPSYHLPHFYELFALWAEEEDRPFWKEAATSA